MKFPKLFLTGCVTLALAGAVWAGGHGGNPAVDARKAHMTLYQFHVTTLGNMARGNTDYNAEAASTAANAIVTLTTLDQSGYWVPGTDSDSVEGSRASATLWDNIPDAIAKGMATAEAAQVLASVAGDGSEAMVGGLQELNTACTACHRAYRVRR